MISQTKLALILALGLALGLAGCTQGGDVDRAVFAAKPADAGVLNVADAAIADADPAMALKISQSVLATQPRDQQALYHEGAAYYALGRCMDAIAAYQLALAADPASAAAQTGIGRCLLIRDAAKAEAAFSAAVADDPGDAEALNDLGIARDLQGKYAAAIQPYQRALLINPGSLPTEVNLGLALALSGDAADALAYLGPLAAGNDSTPKIREDYAAALVAAGRVADAKQILSTSLPPDQVTVLLTDFANAIADAQPPPAQAMTSPPATNRAAPVAQIQSASLAPPTLSRHTHHIRPRAQQEMLAASAGLPR